MPLALVFRYRAGTARRQARGWVTMVNLVGLGISTALFLMGAGLTNIWVPQAFGYSILGLLGGVALGIIGLWMSRWERAPGTLHYTPNRWLVLAVTLIVTGRFAYGLWRGWDRWHHTGGETSFLAAFGVAGSLAAGAVVLGYYLSYWLGLRRRLKAHGRDRAPAG